MGNSQSNRKITVVNDEFAGVIKISDSIVRRLKGEIEREAAYSNTSQSAKTEESNVQPTEESSSKLESTSEPLESPSNEIKTPLNEAPKTESAPVQKIIQTNIQPQNEPRPYEEFMEEAHLTALKIRKDKEAEIRKIEEYWRNQLVALTSKYEELEQLTKAEYLASVADVERCYAKEPYSNVCGDQKEEVLRCYLENKNKPLNCSEHVRRFTECAEQFRLANLAPKSS